MRRRMLLTAITALLPAGLTGRQGSDGVARNAAAELPTARFEMAPIDDGDLPAKVLYSVSSADGGHPDEALLGRILDGGATTRGTRPPLPADRPIAYDGQVVTLAREVAEETPATRYSVKVDIIQETVTDDESVRFSELPEVDRTVFAENGLAAGDVVGIGTTLLYTDEQRADSVLVPESEYEYIVWENGAEAEWVVDDAYDETLSTYRYSVEGTTPAAAYGERLRDRFAFELSDLPSEQREIVETATEDDGYVVGPDESPPPALVDLADRFREHEQVRDLDESGEGDLDGPYLVRYDGTVYWTTFVVDDEAFATATPN